MAKKGILGLSKKNQKYLLYAGIAVGAYYLASSQGWIGKSNIKDTQVVAPARNSSDETVQEIMPG